LAQRLLHKYWCSVRANLGWVADRSLAYRTIFFSGFILIAAGFLGLAIVHGFGAWLVRHFWSASAPGASNTVACLFVVEFTP
jgi:hypothetical protein